MPIHARKPTSRYVLLQRNMALSYDRTVNKADVVAFLESLNFVITESLAAGGDVTLPGVGKFAVKALAERTGRNPATGETITIAAKRTPKFTPNKSLKDAVKG